MRRDYYMIPEGGLLQQKPKPKFILVWVFYFFLNLKSKLLEWEEIKNPKLTFRVFVAEKEGFEPPDLLQSTVFKTAAFDRSAISPISRTLLLNAVANIVTFF